VSESRVKFIALGTRGSELALFQAHHVSWSIQTKNVDLSVKIKKIKPGKAFAGSSLTACSIGSQDQLDKPPC